MLETKGIGYRTRWRHEAAPREYHRNAEGGQRNRVNPYNITIRIQGCVERARYDPNDNTGELKFSRYTQHVMHG
jgi:hypothetical protein